MKKLLLAAAVGGLFALVWKRYGNKGA